MPPTAARSPRGAAQAARSGGARHIRVPNAADHQQHVGPVGRVEARRRPAIGRPQVVIGRLAVERDQPPAESVRAGDAVGGAQRLEGRGDDMQRTPGRRGTSTSSGFGIG